MADVELWGTSCHEAGHLVCAHCLGWRVHGATVVAGDHAAGMARAVPELLPAGVFERIDLDLPFVCWPAEVRQMFEVDVIFAMAGEVARLLLGARPEPGRARRVSLPVAEVALDLAVELPAAGELAAEMHDAVNSPVLSDEERIARTARVAHGPDLASLGSWLAYLEAQTTALVLANRGRVERLAALLQVEGTISGELAARVLDGTP